jgi:hypothetical protein
MGIGFRLSKEMQFQVRLRLRIMIWKEAQVPEKSQH